MQNCRRIFSEIYEDQQFTEGPELPVGAAYSCAVEVEPGIVFISGSTATADNTAAYLIDVNDGNVTTLPEMPKGRAYHACGAVQSEAYGGTDIVVAGGDNDFTVDIFNTRLNIWRPGPALPVEIERVRVNRK